MIRTGIPHSKGERRSKAKLFQAKRKLLGKSNVFPPEGIRPTATLVMSQHRLPVCHAMMDQRIEKSSDVEVEQDHEARPEIEHTR
eukprot:765164-Hanusia_phi.AAC.1